MLIVCIVYNFNLYAQNIPPVTINVERTGTLSNLIPESKKYKITNLTLTGRINGKDILFIREMAGSDYDGKPTEGSLSVLDLSRVKIVGEGSYYHNKETYNDEIGGYMFVNCTNLCTVILPENIKYIGSQSFGSCNISSFTTIPNGIKKIAADAFYHCPDFKGYIISDENPYYSSLDGVLFNKDKTTIVSYPNMKSKTYVIPNGTVTIEPYAFYGCDSLTSVIIPNSVTSIHSGSFLECKSLSSIAIPNSVEYIKYNAFQGCSSLASVVIPEKVKFIDGNCFKNCTNLKSVTIPNSIDSYERANVSICNISGQEVYRETIEGNIQVSLSTGIYVVKVGNKMIKAFVE